MEGSKGREERKELVLAMEKLSSRFHSRQTSQFQGI